MKPHLSDEILQRFTDGALGGRAAMEVALHLDDCAPCANRAACLDPLAGAFASVDDPPLPPGLQGCVTRSLIEARSVPVASHVASFLGLALFMAAAVLLWVGGDAVGLAGHIFMLVYACGVASGAVLDALPTSTLALPVAGVGILVCCVFAFHLLGLSQEAA